MQQFKVSPGAPIAPTRHGEPHSGGGRERRLKKLKQDGTDGAAPRMPQDEGCRGTCEPLTRR